MVCDFVSFLLNYLREQSSVVLQDPTTSSTLTPSKQTHIVCNSTTEHSSTPANHCTLPAELTSTETTDNKNNCSFHRTPFSGTTKKSFALTNSTNYFASPSDQIHTPDSIGRQQSHTVSRPTPRSRSHRTPNLGDFVSPTGSADSSSRSLFSDAPLSSGKRLHGKNKTGSRKTEKVKHDDLSKFELDSSEDFPEMTRKLPRFVLTFLSPTGDIMLITFV